MRFPLLLYSITPPAFLPLFPHCTIRISISVSHYTRDLTIWLRTISVSMCVWLCASCVKTNSLSPTHTHTRACAHPHTSVAEPHSPHLSHLILRDHRAHARFVVVFFFFYWCASICTHRHTEDVHVCACLLLCYVGFFSTMQAAAPLFFGQKPERTGTRTHL